MKYSKPETLKHSLSVNHSNCLVNIDHLIHCEDNSSTTVETSFKGAVVINLDCVEKVEAQAQQRNRNSTMDCSFAIKGSTLPKMLLVEFRFNYTNLKNLDRLKLLNKVSGSISLLGPSVQISQDYIFIFQSSLKSQARSRLFRMNPQIPSNYVVQDLDDLMNTYF